MFEVQNPPGVRGKDSRMYNAERSWLCERDQYCLLYSQVYRCFPQEEATKQKEETDEETLRSRFLVKEKKGYQINRKKHFRMKIQQHTQQWILAISRTVTGKVHAGN